MEEIKKKIRFKVPHTYALLFIMILVLTVLTHLIPAGEFDRVELENRTVVVPDSYHYVEGDPYSFFDAFMAIPKGMQSAAQIIFFCFIIGGSFGLLRSTGAIDVGIIKLADLMKGREKLVIPVLMTIFSLTGAIFGFAEDLLPFYPIVISLALALGFDEIVGTSIVLLGSGVGFASGFLNPFTVGVAQGIAGLPLYTGIVLRLVVYAVLMTVTITYVYKYASKIHKDPTLSVMHGEKRLENNELEINETLVFTNRHKLVMVVSLIGLGVLGFGVLKLGFYINELAATFLLMGIIGGFAGGLSIDKVAEEFINGMKEMIYGAMIIGLATGIMVVMRESKIMDTIIYGLSGLIKGFPPVIAGIGMFIVQSFINFVVPSGSGQAAASMPIMAPLADLVGITRQTSVLAFQFGDAFSNNINPTSGYFMAALAMGGIKWEKWANWMLPLFLLWSLIGAIFVAISVMINYGPF